MAVLELLNHLKLSEMNRVGYYYFTNLKNVPVLLSGVFFLTTKKMAKITTRANTPATGAAIATTGTLLLLPLTVGIIVPSKL